MVSAAPSDDLLESLKAARGRPAVLKTKLAHLRSDYPSILIFAFEGIDDKTVYFHWVKRIRPELSFEPFPCDGKENVLKLRDIVHRDKGNLGHDIYFFIDRDFDDLRGEEPSDDLFMTDAYSVENYLVTRLVMEELLKNEFHCHGELEVRRNVLALFEQVYEAFLQAIKDVNFRLFVARRLSVELAKSLPVKCNHLVTVEVDGVIKSFTSAGDIVVLKREPTAEERASLGEEFEGLEKAMRYRGKFAFIFFTKWLERLAEDRNSEASRFFPPPTSRTKVRFDRINLDSLASKSMLPDGLTSFIQRIPIPN